MMLSVLGQYPDATGMGVGDDGVTQTFACDHFYMMVYNVFSCWNFRRQFIYGTIRSDCGPQYCGIPRKRKLG